MQISVLVEPVAGNGYRAHGAEPFGVSAEAATREEAVAKVRQLCQARLSGGAELVTVKVGPPPVAAVCGHVQGRSGFSRSSGDHGREPPENG